MLLRKTPGTLPNIFNDIFGLIVMHTNNLKCHPYTEHAFSLPPVEKEINQINYITQYIFIILFLTNSFSCNNI